MKTISPAKHISDLPIPKKTISRSDLKTLIPDITDEMMELFLSQSDNIACDPRGRRWSQKIITACLQWYCRSPQAYQAFRATKLLILPSPSTLVLYKNKVKQEVGFDGRILEWMHAEAVRKGLHEDGWMGGIVIDEMAIQADLQIAKNGDVVKLCGFADVGGEGNNCAILRTGKNEKDLGTYICNAICFLGTDRFSLPICSFYHKGVQGSELYTLFWKAVDELQMFGFKVVFTSLDGAQSNRNFVKYNLCGQFTKTFILNQESI